MGKSFKYDHLFSASFPLLAHLFLITPIYCLVLSDNVLMSMSVASHGSRLG